MSFSRLGLMADLQRAVSVRGWDRPAPIQAQGIPVIPEGRDVLARAPSGTGTTAAFTLPRWQPLTGRGRRKAHGSKAPHALVSTPSRDVATRRGESATPGGAHRPLGSAVIFGGVDINPQEDALRFEVDVLVATPGRALDPDGPGAVDLSAEEIAALSLLGGNAINLLGETQRLRKQTDPGVAGAEPQAEGLGAGPRPAATTGAPGLVTQGPTVGHPAPAGLRRPVPILPLAQRQRRPRSRPHPASGRLH